MGIRGRRPGGKTDGGGYWRWLKVRPGQAGEGWIAGDLHIYPAHMGRPSTVCEKALTGGRLPCHQCVANMPARELGYLPIWRDDYVPCVLIVHEYSFDGIGRLPHLSQIAWGRAEGDDAEAVYVQQTLRQVRFETSHPSRRLPQDISVAMARYWRRPDLLPDLVRWLRGDVTGDESPPPELAARVAAAAKPPPAAARSSSREAIASVTGEELPPLLNDVSREMLKRNKHLAAAVATNGKPK